MADLDDFFAKKDRKKSKGKKFATADEIAKKLEETGKKNEKLKKDKLQTQSSGQEVDEQGNAIKEEDEWKDFEEEKKDYSGLKIQNLTILENEESGEGMSGGEDEDGGMEENEAGELVPKRKSGPWKVLASETAPPSEPVETMSQQPPQQPSPQRTIGGSYKPPALRNQPLAPIRLRKATAPDVKNEELFPSLSAAKVIDPSKKKRDDIGPGGQRLGDFEEVKASKSSAPGRYEPPHMRQPKLALDNKYGALSES